MTMRHAAPLAAALPTAAPAFAQQVPTDVPAGHWAYDALKTLYAKGIFQGYPDGRFLQDVKNLKNLSASLQNAADTLG